jgi:hypothetical protein
MNNGLFVDVFCKYSPSALESFVFEVTKSIKRNSRWDCIFVDAFYMYLNDKVEGFVCILKIV